VRTAGTYLFAQIGSTFQERAFDRIPSSNKFLGPNLYPPVNKRNLSTGENGENIAKAAELSPN
jgi:hypothetical protein